MVIDGDLEAEVAAAQTQLPADEPHRIGFKWHVAPDPGQSRAYSDSLCAGRRGRSDEGGQCDERHPMADANRGAVRHWTPRLGG